MLTAEASDDDDWSVQDRRPNVFVLEAWLVVEKFLKP